MMTGIKHSLGPSSPSTTFISVEPRIMTSHTINRQHVTARIKPSSASSASTNQPAPLNTELISSRWV
jgi:hypothetical protein